MTTCALIRLLAIATAISVPTPAQDPSFEVATVKVSRRLSDMEQLGRDRIWEGIGLGKYPVAGRTLKIDGARLSQIIAMAFGVRPTQVAGNKDLLLRRFDIEAKLEQDVPDAKVGEMLRTLLVERFQLKTHSESKTQPVLELLSRAGATSLKPADPTKKSSDFNFFGDPKRGSVPTGYISFRSGHCSMPSLADYLQSTLKTLVVDRTQLQGEYEVQFAVESGQEANEQDRVAQYAVALRGIGLDLRKGSAPVKLVVVDSVSKTPAEN